LERRPFLQTHVTLEKAKQERNSAKTTPNAPKNT
jgi:hypothetical protein